MERDRERWFVLFLICCIPVFLTGCGVVRRARGNVPSPTASATGVVTATTTPEALDLDFEAMDFVEMNNLFILLLESLPEGIDASAAEAFYSKALDAMLEGDPQMADFCLEQAILMLLELEP